VNLVGATIIDNALVGTTRRGRIVSVDTEHMTVTVLWPRGQYNTVRPEAGRYTVEVQQ
jgi:hypothetical protein